MAALTEDCLSSQPIVAETACPRCGYVDVAGARFCSECGLRRVAFCPSCGSPNRAAARFCQACGVQVGPGASWPDGNDLPGAALAGAFGSGANGVSRTVERAEEAVPGPLATGLVDEERRVVTVLFADLVGYTALSERLDPEEVREIAAATLAKLVEAIAQFGGTVDKLLGDAVMALFGAPAAHQDDPIRALRAALAMQEAMRRPREPEDGEDSRDRRLQLRVGINTGEVVAGSRDVGGYREYSVFGDVVNTAARLQTAAPPGGILVGEATARLAERAFRLEPVEPLELRGKEQPVPAFRVLGPAQPTDDAPTVGSDGLRGPLVGRIGELRRLRERLQDLARGRGQIASIIGEHGIGKSRLLGELRPYAESLGLRWSEARAPSYGQGLSYRMVREVIGVLFGIQDGDSDQIASSRLRDGLRELEVEPAYAGLAFVLGLPLDSAGEAELRGLGAERIQRRAFGAARQLLGALARRQPLVLVLDDLQWADPSSVDLFADVMAVSDEAPIFFCFAFTPERDAPSWGLKELAARAYPHRYAEVTLSPLSDQAAHDLVCALLDCAETPPNLEEMVLAKAEGNPYFVEEVLRSLIEQGDLRRVGDHWVAERDIRELDIPNTLLAIVTARIDRLPDGVRRTLQVAAVIGREFPERVLRRVAEGPGLADGDAARSDLHRHLRDAQRAELIREEALLPERSYAFTQGLIREAAFRSLLLRRRKELHVLVGRAIEDVYADDLDEQLGALASHFHDGEDWERAFRYGRQAAERAARAYANDEAIANYTIALEAAARSAAGADPEVVAELEEQRADVETLVGAYERAITGYEAALRHHQAVLEAGPAADEAEHVGLIAVKLARAHSFRNDVPAMERALAVAFARLPEDSPDLGAAWGLKASAHIWRSETEAAGQAARRALALAREGGSAQQLNVVYQAVTQPALIGAIGSKGREIAPRWIELAREQADPPMLYRALVAQTFLDTWGYWSFGDDNLRDVVEALELARTFGSPAAENTARGLHGAGLFLRGRWDEAEQELRHVSGQPTSLFALDAINDFWLARLLTLRGALDEALGLIRFRLDGPFNPHVQTVQHAQLALNRRLAGDDDAADAAMERATRALSEVGCMHCALFLHAAAAEFYAESGDAASAAPHVARARELGTTFDRKPALLAARRADGLLKLNAGDLAGAVEELRAAARFAQTLEQPYEAARTAFLLARAYRAGGDAEAAAAKLGWALGVFEELRAEPDVQAVRVMLV